jgi:hypothetical protein
MSTSTSGRIGAALLGVEGLALLAIVLWQVRALVLGDTDSLESALALLVLTGIGTLAVLAFAVATWRRQSWGRSGGIVTQLLILAVALGAATGAYADPQTALLLAVPAVATLVLLVIDVRASAGRARREEREDESPEES